MLVSSVRVGSVLYQIPLIQVVESDDHFLDEADVLWFQVLRDLDWQPLVPIAVQYYEALWQFNQDQLLERLKKQSSPPVPNPETKKDARQRILFERTTLDPEKPVLAAAEANLREPLHVDPATIRPGRICIPGPLGPGMQIRPGFRGTSGVIRRGHIVCSGRKGGVLSKFPLARSRDAPYNTG